MEKGFVVKRALLCALIFLIPVLAGCVPDQEDPAKSSDAGQLGGGYYASALGNVATQVQNAVVGDPSWFSEVSAEQLDLAALGISADTTGVPIRSQMCPTGTGTEVVQLTWLDGRDAGNRFWVNGIGAGARPMVGALRNRVSGNQVGIYDAAGSLRMASGSSLAIPSSCAGANIPLGAPVLVFRIERPAPPVQETARTEYRTVPCGVDERGIEQRGTMVQSRIVRFAADGAITPIDREEGWSAESIGNCISDALVDATSSTRTDGGSVVLSDFMDLTAQGFKAMLEEQLRMDCATTSIHSDIMRKDAQGNLVRSRKDKDIDTCTRATTSAAGGQVSDNDSTDGQDTRDVCIEKSMTIPNRAFLGVELGTLTGVLAGTAYVDRTVDNRALGSNGSQVGERAKWVGRETIDCTSNDTYVVNCADVPGKPSGPHVAATGGKWNSTGLEEYLVESSVGGTIYTLDWDYFNSTETLHGRDSTTTAVGSRTAGNWLDRVENFIPNFTFNAFSVPGAGNQCLIKKREIQLDCPLTFDPSKQAGWNPYELSPTADFVTTLIPGGSYSGTAGVVYRGSQQRGETPGLVEIASQTCNIKGCSNSTELAGPGLEAYIKSWTYSDTNSLNGLPSSVQTIMMNKDGQVIDYKPDIVPGPKLEYVGRYSVPLHCGRIERRTFGWPSWAFYVVCNLKGGCHVEWWPGPPVEITEVVTREWIGNNAAVGSWSRPAVRYVSPYGTWTSVSEIPNPIVYFGGARIGW